MAESLADKRAHAEKTVEAIEAVIEGRATHDVAQYTIGGRFISKMAVGELIALKKHYQSELQRIKNVERRNAGLATGRIIKASFV